MTAFNIFEIIDAILWVVAVYYAVRFVRYGRTINEWDGKAAGFGLWAVVSFCLAALLGLFLLAIHFGGRA